MRANKRHTVAHITHEAVEKMGGIGTVLEGLMTSGAYQGAVERSILVGPLIEHHQNVPAVHLSAVMDIRYSTIDGIDIDGLGRRLHPIEHAYGVRFVYGHRRYTGHGTSLDGNAEVLLIDVMHPKPGPLGVFKNRLWKSFGLDSRKYEHDWSFEEYCRLAEPAFYALSALLPDAQLPCILISHEFMGICTALKAAMDGGGAFRTVFHAHECSTARRIVEHHPGHDTAFYNIMHQARANRQSVEDIFGGQADFLRHALVARTHYLDAIMAVGDPTRDEMQFLSPEMADTHVDLVYNGIASIEGGFEQIETSRTMLLDWAQRIAGFRPDFFMTHVARPVISKGFWRDLKVLHHLEQPLRDRKERALLTILTCGASPRSFDEVSRMHREYGWPWCHREGYPDLVGPEIELARMVKAFNETHDHVQAVLVNQFGWQRDALGDYVDPAMSFTTLRQGADAEFGQSVYEPFGIAQLEPLGGGAICVASSVCGCVTSYQSALRAMNATQADFPNVIVADYTNLDSQQPIETLLTLGRSERDAVEERIAKSVANQLANDLPRSADDRQRLHETGTQLARQLSWDRVILNGMLPVLDRITARRQKNTHHTPTQKPQQNAGAVV